MWLSFTIFGKLGIEEIREDEDAEDSAIEVDTKFYESKGCLLVDMPNLKIFKNYLGANCIYIYIRKER